MVEERGFTRTATSREGVKPGIDVNLFGGLDDAFLGVMFWDQKRLVAYGKQKNYHKYQSKSQICEKCGQYGR